MDYRILETTEQFEQAVDVEIAVWGVPPRETVPPSMIRAVTHAGGVAHGAYDGNDMVGMAVAFPAQRDGKFILWSHMTGVLPAYQGRDIGFTLKQKQREWALAHGCDKIGWTFDPLRRGNAHFNLHRLGTIAKVYLVNFYGEMRDALNAGIPTDRLEVIWQLNAPRVASLAAGEDISPNYPEVTPDNTLLSSGNYNTTALQRQHEYVFAEIPAALKPAGEDKLQWRLALRQALQTAFAAGYTAVDFIKAQEKHWYLLRQL